MFSGLLSLITIVFSAAVGELNTVEVFAQVINNNAYYKNKNPVKEKVDQLKKEINLGLWDTYLFWGPESYRNLKNNNQMLEFLQEHISEYAQGRNKQ